MPILQRLYLDDSRWDYGHLLAVRSTKMVPQSQVPILQRLYLDDSRWDYGHLLAVRSTKMVPHDAQGLYAVSALRSNGILLCAATAPRENRTTMTARSPVEPE